MKVMGRDVKLIASPHVPLGHIAVSYRVYHYLQVEIGELVPLEVGGLKNYYVGWANDSDSRKAMALTKDDWVLLSDKTPGVEFDYRLMNDAPIVVPKDEPMVLTEDSKLARAAAEKILGKDLMKDVDIEIYKPGPQTTTARVYYKAVIISAGGGSKKTIHEALSSALLGLQEGLREAVSNIDSTRERIWDHYH